MDFFGIGGSELALIVIIAIIVLGKDMKSTSRAVGRWMYNFVRSDEGRALKNMSNDLIHLPNKLMREAALEELDLDPSLSASRPKNPRLPVATEEASIAPATLSAPLESPAPPEISETERGQENPNA